MRRGPAPVVAASMRVATAVAAPRPNSPVRSIDLHDRSPSAPTNLPRLLSVPVFTVHFFTRRSVGTHHQSERPAVTAPECGVRSARIPRLAQASPCRRRTPAPSASTTSMSFIRSGDDGIPSAPRDRPPGSRPGHSTCLQPQRRPRTPPSGTQRLVLVGEHVPLALQHLRARSPSGLRSAHAAVVVMRCWRASAFGPGRAQLRGPISSAAGGACHFAQLPAPWPSDALELLPSSTRSGFSGDSVATAWL